MCRSLIEPTPNQGLCSARLAHRNGVNPQQMPSADRARAPFLKSRGRAAKNAPANAANNPAAEVPATADARRGPARSAG